MASSIPFGTGIDFTSTLVKSSEDNILLRPLPSVTRPNPVKAAPKMIKKAVMFIGRLEMKTTAQKIDVVHSVA